MNKRRFGKKGWEVSEIGLGAWQLGGDCWGDISEKDAIGIIATSLENGLNIIDTADVYGDGRSERVIGKALKELNVKDKIYVFSKAGRKLPQVESEFTAQKIEGFLDDTLKNLGTDCLDLLQLHCPPTGIFYRSDIFELLESFVQKGKMRAYGVSVEKAEEGIKAMDFPNLASVQIIFNIFRQRPKGLFFEMAKRTNTAVIVRVPLASGLLTGKNYAPENLPDNDHRKFNFKGEMFDVGETFAGVPLDAAAKAMEELKPLMGQSPAAFALRWILMFPEVSTIIPGATSAAQAKANIAAADLPAIDAATMTKVSEIYDRHIHKHVHHRW